MGILAYIPYYGVMQAFDHQPYQGVGAEDLGDA